MRVAAQGEGFWRIGLIGCAVLMFFVLFSVSAVTYFAGRNPYFRGVTDCRVRIQLVGEAVDRYVTKNDIYPDSLDDLAPDYVHARLLHCPVVKGGVAKLYEYHKPAAGARGGVPVIVCRNHKLGRSFDPGGWIYRKDGKTMPLNQGGADVKPVPFTSPVRPR